MTEHLLSGATPEPLAAYLTGLGVLRLLAEQGHGEATARWDDRGMLLDVDLDPAQLREFFLIRYVPTPMVSPWNRGAGFRDNGKSKSAEDLVERASVGDNPRLGDLRTAIAVARDLNAAHPDDKDFARAKDDLIQRARSRMPDVALPWIDAAVTLTADGPVYPHILGTGGNLGRLELSSNALGHIGRIIGFNANDPSTNSAEWLDDALFATGSQRLRDAKVGQFDPGVAGGFNSSSRGDGDSLVNPWSFVLALEGAVVFASGLARRLGNHRQNVAAMPFTLRSDPVGAAHLSATEEPKGELWLPLWDAPATYDQVRALFAEGRIRWRGQTATRALDAARAVATLGSQRGVDAFARVVIIDRLGQSPLAIPVGRIATGNRRAPGLTGQLDAWLRRIRRVGNPPGSLTGHLRTIDQALADVSTSPDGGSRDGLHRLLVAAWNLEAVLGRNQSLQSVGPAPGLDRTTWLPLLDDGTGEFRLAAALTTSKDTEQRQPRDRQHTSSGSWRPRLIEYLRPIAVIERRTGWDRGPRLAHDVRNNVVHTLARIHASHAEQPRTFDGATGTWPAFDSAQWISHRDVEAFLAEQLDTGLFTSHLQATSMLTHGRSHRSVRQSAPASPASPGWRLLSSVVHANGPSTERTNRDAGTIAGPQPRAAWIGSLVRGQVQPVVQSAITQLARVPDREPPRHAAAEIARAADGPGLAAALLFHLTPTSRTSVLDWACRTREFQPPKPPATQGDHDS